MLSPWRKIRRTGRVARLVASPRHADALLVTGIVTRNMAEPLRRTFDVVPAPKLVVAVGDCARNCGVFGCAYGVAGAVRDVVPVALTGAAAVFAGAAALAGGSISLVLPGVLPLSGVALTLDPLGGVVRGGDRWCRGGDL